KLNNDLKDQTVWVKIKTWWDDLWNDDGKPKKSRSKRGATNPDRFHNYHGNILEHYAQGGLKPMEPIAQMVNPNTWRVVGDRMKDDEAYIPLDGSPRSKALLMEAIVRMPNLMHDGGILNFAAGGVAASPRAKAILVQALVPIPNLIHDGVFLNFAAGGVAAASADAEPKVLPATVEPPSSAITEAFANLTALLAESWNGPLPDMLGKTA